MKTGLANNDKLHTDNISFKISWSEVLKKDYEEAFRARDIMEKLLAVTGKRLGEPELLEEYHELKGVVDSLNSPKLNETPEETKQRQRVGGYILNDVIESKDVYPEIYEVFDSKGLVTIVKELRENYDENNPVRLQDLVEGFYKETPVHERNFRSFTKFYKRSLSTHGLYGTTLVNGVYERRPMKFGNEDIHEYEPYKPYVPYNSVELSDDDEWLFDDEK